MLSLQWEKGKHYRTGAPSGTYETTLYLAKKGKPRLETVEWI